MFSRLLNGRQSRREEIEATIKAIEELDQKLKENPGDSNSRDERRILVVDLGKELLAFQVDELMAVHLRDGNLVEVLSTSDLVGRHLDLTDVQRNRIQERSNKIGLEIREFLIEKRKEAAEVVIGELSMEQNEKLVEVFGAEKLNYAYGAWPASHFIWNLMYGSENRDKLSKEKWSRYNLGMTLDTYWNQ